MRRIRFRLIGMAIAALAAARAGLCADTNAPDFMEVYDLIRAHSGIGEAELNRKTIEALVSSLDHKARLTSSSETAVPEGQPYALRTTLFDGDIAYFRIGKVGSGLEKAFRSSYNSIGVTNRLRGLVLDLRFADGTDYAAAAATADLFVKDERWLLKWDDNSAHSKSKTDAITVPVAVLVNHRTSGAAEALAAVLRDTGSGLVLGSRTAGQANVFQDFTLKNGQHLQIASSPVRLGDGSALSSDGLQPDISVEVNPREEQIYFTDAYSVIGKTNLPPALALNGSPTNRPPRRFRFNEAELVRERREGANADSEAAVEDDNESDERLVRDPALARALDLLKGLAVVRHTHS